MAGGVYYPWAPQNGNNQPANFPYDVVIQENFPGVVFIPLEPGGVYSVIREVDGSLWFVTNADWNPNTSQWEQDSPYCNANNPAFAFQLGSTGNMQRLVSPPTEVPGDAITWQEVYNIDSTGSVVQAPTPIVTTTPQNHLLVTWDAGIDTQQTAWQTDISDEASSANSIYQYMTLNGTGKWLIDKNGILQEGQIPFARITGFSPVFNNATFNGTTTFNGPIVANDGETLTGGLAVDTVDASGSITASSYAITGGGFLSDAPTTTSAGLVVPSPGSSVTVNIHSSHGYPVGTTVIISGSGTSTPDTFTGTVTAINATPETSITVYCSAVLAGSPGDTLNPGAVVSFTTVYGTVFESTNNTVAISDVGNPPTVNLTVDEFPAVITQSYTVPVVGSTVSGLQTTQSRVLYTGAVVLIVSGNNDDSLSWLAQITSSVINTSPTLVSLKCLAILTGTAGEVRSANQDEILFGYYPPSVEPLLVGGVAVAAVPVNSTGSNSGPASVTLTLPGTAASSYSVVVECNVGTGGADNMDLTCTGGTFPGTAENWATGNFASYIFGYNVGTGVGGQTISATTSKGFSNFFRITATRTS